MSSVLHFLQSAGILKALGGLAGFFLLMWLFVWDNDRGGRRR